MKKLVALAAMAAMFGLLTACGDPAADLPGTWTQVGGSATGSSITLDADGTGSMKISGGMSYPISEWTAAGGQLRLTIFEEEVNVDIEVDGPSLTLSGFDDYEQMNGRYARR